jgi:hypothetical protein
MTSTTAEEKAFLRAAVAAIPRVAEIIWRFVQHGVGVELDAVLPVDQTVSASR